MKLPILLLLLLSVMQLFNCKAYKKHAHPVHNFETHLKKSQHGEQREKYVITKREEGLGKLRHEFNMKKHHIENASEEKKHLIATRLRSKTPKNIIEGGSQGNPFGHLSELLGLKGSFIPSQSRQRWMEDEEQNAGSKEGGDDMNPEAQSAHRETYNNDLATEKGTLPLDISPQQAAMITSTADKNSQRRKFLQWEKQGGSMDTRHFPSTFIKGEDTEATKRVSTQRNFEDSDKFKAAADLLRAEGGQTKQEVPSLQSSKPSANRLDSEIGSSWAEGGKTKQEVPNLQKQPETYSDVANKDKKQYMGFMSNQFGTLDSFHGLSSELSPGHNFLGNAMHSPNEQPLTHDMINKLQLDPAWDAMEAKILAQHGRRVMPMPLPVSKIDKEMMPPDGIPIGQAYLPAGNHAHSSLLDNFHKNAGFEMKPLRPDFQTSYYSHFQPDGGPHTINVGGALVNAVGNPWKNLKQTTYDHADDNFPLASLSQQSSGGTSATESPKDDGGKPADEVSESVGKPLTKVKGKKFADKEASKAVGPKSDDNDEEAVGGKQSFRENSRKKPNLVLVKGKKFGKEENDKKNDENEEDEDQERKQNKQRKVRPSSNQREQNTGEDDDDKVMKMVKVKGKRPSRVQADEEEDQGPHFSRQESNSQVLQYGKIGGNPQMSNGQQWQMEPGKHQEQFKTSRLKEDNTGRYITKKFVNFLSDVAHHLNVDKLSVAEQLVKDVEESKTGDKEKSNLVSISSANKLIQDLQELPVKRRRVGGIAAKSPSTVGALRIGRKQPTVIKYIWNKGISVLKEE